MFLVLAIAGQFFGFEQHGDEILDELFKWRGADHGRFAYLSRQFDLQKDG